MSAPPPLADLHPSDSSQKNPSQPKFESESESVANPNSSLGKVSLHCRLCKDFRWLLPWTTSASGGVFPGSGEVEGFPPDKVLCCALLLHLSTALQERDAKVAFKMKSSTGHLSFLTVQMLHGALTLALCPKILAYGLGILCSYLFFCKSSRWYSQCEARLLLYFSFSVVNANCCVACN